MQLKVFILPLKNVSAAEAEMNAFLRSHRVLAVRKEFELEDWGTDRIMAGQNHLLNGVKSTELVALVEARLVASAPLAFMILSRHDSVIPLRNNPYAD
jgi:hypothetical protein